MGSTEQQSQRAFADDERVEVRVDVYHPRWDETDLMWLPANVLTWRPATSGPDRQFERYLLDVRWPSDCRRSSGYQWHPAQSVRAPQSADV
jgi:hypothetical protein